MENEVLQRKDPFPKKVSDACRVLAGWKNQYGNKDTRLTEAKDGVAFMTMRKRKALRRRMLHVTNVEKQRTTPTSAMK